jgi:hypothetical protein
MTPRDLKSAIKSLSAKQRETKLQRKSVSFTGERSLTPNDAQLLALSQKWELKHMFIAYAIVRGKSIETAIKPDTEYSTNKVEELVKKYGEVVCVSAD